MMEFSQSGMAELLQALDTLPAKLERNVVRGALRDGAKEIVEAAKRQVPARTGKLRDSIRVSVRVRRGVPEATIKAGSKAAWYAALVEFGTAAHLIKARPGSAINTPGGARAAVQHPGAKKHPFMRPALDAAAQAAVERYAAYIRRRLTKQGIEIPAPPDDQA